MRVKLWVVSVAVTVFVNLLNDLLKGGWLDLHAHHGEDAAHVVRGDRAVLVREPVEAALEHLDLDQSGVSIVVT